MTDPTTEIPSDTRLALFKVATAGLVLHLLIILAGARFGLIEPIQNQPTPKDQALRILASESPGWAQAWYHWDSLWFVHLSRFGYQLQVGADGLRQQSNIAFTPGLPLVIQALAQIGLNPWSGTILLNMLAAFLARLGIGFAAYQATQCQKTAIWSVVLFTAWPWQFFLVAPYQEACGLACVVWSVYLGRRQSYLPAFLLSFAAGLFRLNAIGFFGGFLAGTSIEIVRKKLWRAPPGSVFFGTGAIVSWLLLLLYFYFEFGDARISILIQQTWNRHEPSLMGLLESRFSPLLQKKLTGTGWLDWFVVWPVLLIIPRIWTRLGPAWAMALAGLAAQSLSTGSVMSFGRLMLLGVPFFVFSGRIAASKPRLAIVVSAVSALVQMALLWRYIHGLFGG